MKDTQKTTVVFQSDTIKGEIVITGITRIAKYLDMGIQVLDKHHKGSQEGHTTIVFDHLLDGRFLCRCWSKLTDGCTVTDLLQWYWGESDPFHAKEPFRGVEEVPTCSYDNGHSSVKIGVPVMGELNGWDVLEAYVRETEGTISHHYTPATGHYIEIDSPASPQVGFVTEDCSSREGAIASAVGYIEELLNGI